ncbi:hypothetical protein JJB07_12340 [Tumebacillus sp. ITR2]|uniref:GIY-YIG domain-containing protein n=1 Tax=Tumebacillus amylolyticus TaxID=2801339 RepID=A0ABS1JAY2_9BACL|nr:hypothetical protein [Tumebacillus amylolyticus]MBL0387442.1 hypothetical protein [Tumebacillus amylolyticus]
MYRIKPVGHDKLYYIGQTGRNLKERVVGALVKHTQSEDMPFNDPHTAAPSLWAWQDAEGLAFEFSVAPMDLSTPTRKGLESYLLWRYRIEFGESAMCNFGRFHPEYVKSKERKKQIRGHRLPTGIYNPAGGRSTEPLHRQGKATDLDWMGLDWSPVEELRCPEALKSSPRTTGLYKLVDLNSNEIIYLGESFTIRDRLKSHSKKEWQSLQIGFSYVDLSEQEIREAYMLKELENDLIGAFWEENQRSPRFQFRNEK